MSSIGVRRSLAAKSTKQHLGTILMNRRLSVRQTECFL